NLSAIIWLYRGQQHRFLGLVRDYILQVCKESRAISDKLTAFVRTLVDLRQRFDRLKSTIEKRDQLNPKEEEFIGARNGLNEAERLYEGDREKLLASSASFNEAYGEAPPTENSAQHAAREQFEPTAEAMRGLIKQVDLVYKLAARVAELGNELAADDEVSAAFDRRATGRLVKQLDEGRKAAVEQLKHAVYFHRQGGWLQERFRQGELEAVPGLVKLVDRKEIEAADWSLAPGRYVGVPPPDEDEDFDFEQALRDIRTELYDLNKEAAELASNIEKSFEELGA